MMIARIHADRAGISAADAGTDPDDANSAQVALS
jgi:hypothetical protein